jgi:hypothetical protein
MDKVRKPNISVSYTPSSEPYSIYSENMSLKGGTDIKFALVEWTWVFLRFDGNNSIIIIIISKIRLFSAKALLKNSARFKSGFHFNFATTILFYRARSSALRPNSNLENQVSVCISPRDRVAQLYHTCRAPFSSPSTARRARVEVF